MQAGDVVTEPFVTAPRTPALMVARPMVCVPPEFIVVSVPVSPLVIVAEVVATLAKVLALEKYGMLPMTALVEVERPAKVKAPAELLYASGKVAESDEEETLLLKRFQSLEERYPLVDAVD